MRGIEERAPRIFAPEVVALRLRPARHPQPAARQALRARRAMIATIREVEAEADEQGAAAVAAARWRL